MFPFVSLVLATILIHHRIIWVATNRLGLLTQGNDAVWVQHLAMRADVVPGLEELDLNTRTRVILARDQSVRSGIPLKQRDADELYLNSKIHCYACLIELRLCGEQSQQKYGSSPEVFWKFEHTHSVFALLKVLSRNVFIVSIYADSLALLAESGYTVTSKSVFA